MGGDLVSIETEEEWQFINREIKKRATWITGALHIGLEKKGGVWTWLSGEQLNIRNGKFLSQMLTKKGRKYPRMVASLTVFLGMIKINAFARCGEVRSHFNHKVYYVLKHYSLATVS